MEKIVPDTNVIVLENFRVLKEKSDESDICLPRVVLEEIEFNYLVNKMLKNNARSIVVIREDRIMVIRLLEIEKEDEKTVHGFFITTVYPSKETVADRLLDAIYLEECRNGRTERYYQLEDELMWVSQRIAQRKRKKRRSSHQMQMQEKKAKVIKKAFLSSSAEIYLQLLDLIYSGKWKLITSSGTGLKQLIQKVFQDGNLKLVSKRENGVGANDIRVLAAALRLAIESEEKVVLLTADKHLFRTWQIHEQEIREALRNNINNFEIRPLYQFSK